MAKNPETTFKENLFGKLRLIPNTYFKKIEAGAVCGIPDVLICCNGFFVMVELKVEGRKPTAIQVKNMTRINQCGGMSFVLYPEDQADFLEWLTQIASL